MDQKGHYVVQPLVDWSGTACLLSAQLHIIKLELAVTSSLQFRSIDDSFWHDRVYWTDNVLYGQEGKGLPPNVFLLTDLVYFDDIINGAITVFANALGLRIRSLGHRVNQSTDYLFDCLIKVITGLWNHSCLIYFLLNLEREQFQEVQYSNGWIYNLCPAVIRRFMTKRASFCFCPDFLRPQ